MGKMIIGIDIGSTTTKAVCIENGEVIHKTKTKAADAVTSATGAFGKMIVENGVKMNQIRKIMITGAGAIKIEDELFGISTGKTGEFESIGIGGMFLAGRDNIVIANIGTGTAIVDARKDHISHMGGSGVGGGTILGLAKKLLSTSDFNGIMALAEQGRLNQVDLLLEDIMGSGLSFLNGESTAANFGKMLDTARNEDIALGIVNMVYQVIGMLSVFAAKSRNTDRVVVTGNGSGNQIGKKVLNMITELYRVTFEYPEDAEYTTAIGAGLSALQD
ncbi:MAG: pantothenate kinase [Treponema sp.]|jgi:type II pantothenate kinase|nr:pantothenate kinase [Treponema sp.]